MKSKSNKSKSNTKYLVIGVGKFGMGFVDRLINEGVDEKLIYMVDESESVIEDLNSKGFTNITVDKVTNVQLLENTFPLNEIHVILLGTSDFKDSIELAYSLSTCEYKFKKVYAKASSSMHKKILENFGINSECIAIPETEVGRRMAIKSFYDNKTEIIDFDSDFTIINLTMTNDSLKGKTLKEISDIWNEKYESRNWNMVSITDNYNKTFVATPDKPIYVDYRISIFCSKYVTKDIYFFFTKNNI